jgi:hypothetical protein
LASGGVAFSSLLGVSGAAAFWAIGLRRQADEPPELHTIRSATPSPSYSCRPKAAFLKGYQSTALFLSLFSEQRNSPDLLFNGACGADDYFEASTAGDDMSLIADLGANVRLEEVSASRAFNL